MNTPMGEWSVNEMMSATALITEIGELLCAEAMLGLMSGVIRENTQIDDGMLTLLNASVEQMKESGGDDAIERFVQVVTVMSQTSRVFLDGLVRGMEMAGIAMPNPDTVVIPDTVPDGLEGL